MPISMLRALCCAFTLFSAQLMAAGNDASLGAQETNDSISSIVALRGDGDGAALFRSQCGTCHMGDSSKTKAPSAWHLSSMSPRAVMFALEAGKMKEQGAQLDAPAKAALVAWLTGATPGEDELPKAAYCADKPAATGMQVLSSGWGGRPEADGYRPFNLGGLDAASVKDLQLQWVFAVPGAGEMRSKPAVAGPYLLFGSQFGTVYALDRVRGCVVWTYEAGTAIRGAITVREESDGGATAFFADMRGTVYALDAAAGTVRWSASAASHYMASVTGSVAYHDGRLIVPFSSTEILSTTDSDYPCCKTSGEVVAVDAKNGRVLWRHQTVRDAGSVMGRNSQGSPSYGPSGAPVWSSPTIDRKRGLVYFGTGENFTHPATDTSDAIQALDLKTGELVWSYQATANDVWNLDCFDDNDAHCPDPGPDVDFGMAPMLVTRADGTQMLVVGQKSGHIHALDPDANGKLLWRTRVGRGGALGGIHWGMAADSQRAYAPLADYPAFVVVDLLPLQPSTPGVAALDLETGDLVWRHDNPAPACAEDDMGCLRANSAAVTAIPGAVLTGSMDGLIRALSTVDGKTLWVFDTAREFEGVNGLPANGGSIDGPGPVVADGMLYVLSGYTTNTGLAGNALFAFATAASVDGVAAVNAQ